jgi:hypothetical protein
LAFLSAMEGCRYRRGRRRGRARPRGRDPTTREHEARGPPGRCRQREPPAMEQGFTYRTGGPNRRPPVTVYRPVSRQVNR